MTPDAESAVSTALSPLTPADPLSWAQALVGLYLLANFRYASDDARGKTPAPCFFTHQGVLAGLTAGTTRRVALRLARRTGCLACGKELRPGSTGDHIIPVSAGGPQGLENYIPLCASHNASKGTKDLLEFWRYIGRPACELPADALIAYSRLMFVRVRDRDLLRANASPEAYEVVEELFQRLPSEDHKRDWWLRVCHMTGRS